MAQGPEPEAEGRLRALLRNVLRLTGAQAAALIGSGPRSFEIAEGPWSGPSYRQMAGSALGRCTPVFAKDGTVALPLWGTENQPVGALVLRAADGALPETTRLEALSAIVAEAIGGLAGDDPVRAQMLHLRRRYEDLVDSVQGIVWEADAETFRFTFVSRQAEQILGYPVSRWLEEPSFWIDHLHPEDRTWAVEFCRLATREGRDHAFEYRMIAADGRIVWLRDMVTVVHEEGRPIRLRGIMVDVTDQKAVEAERRRLYERIRRQAELAGCVIWATERLNTRLTVDEVVRTVGLGLLEIAETDRAAVVLVGPDRRFTFAWTVGLSPEDCAQIAEHLSNAPQRDDLIVQTALSGVQLAAWPALYEGRALAFLVALRGTRRGWSEEEREALRTLARQAGLALRNARLMEEAARRARQQEALHRLSTVLARADTVREVCEATVRAAQDILGYRAIGVFLLDPATGDRVLQAGHGWPDLFTGHRIPPGQGLSDRAVRTGRTSYCPDVRLDPAYIPGAPDARSELDVPIRMDGSVAGVLVVEQDRVDGFAPEEIATLEATANLVGVALERARLLEEARGRAEHFAALLEFGAALRTTRSPEEMYPIVVRRAMSLVRADRAALALLEPGRRMPTLVALRGSRLDRPVLPADAVAVIRDTPQPVLLPQWPSASGRGERGPTALVPIRAERDVLGILMVGRRGVQAPEFTDREMGLLRGIAEVAGNAIRRAQLLTQLEQAYMDLVLALARAMDARDTYTANHSERIAVWAERTARALGCSEAEIRQIRWAALLHDIGKVGVPDRILRKPGPLTAEEWVEIRRHPVVGEEILRPIAALREVARIVRHHQERWDGMGYPDGLRGEEIPLGARIIAVVDTYGAITDHRPYRPARTHAEAVEELRRCAGTQLDPRIVEVFLGVLEADSDLQPVGA